MSAELLALSIIAVRKYLTTSFAPPPALFSIEPKCPQQTTAVQFTISSL